MPYKLSRHVPIEKSMEEIDVHKADRATDILESDPEIKNLLNGEFKLVENSSGCKLVFRVGSVIRYVDLT